MIEPKQIQLIHIAKSQLGLDEDHYRAIIEGRNKRGKTSSADLTYFEADAVINFLVKGLGFKIKEKYTFQERAAKKHSMRRWRKGRPSNVYCLASHDQLNMINSLAAKIIWRVEDGFHHWMKKYIKIDRIKTDDEACDVIEGLKGLLDNQNKACHCEPLLERRGNLTGEKNAE